MIETTAASRTHGSAAIRRWAVAKPAIPLSSQLGRRRTLVVASPTPKHVAWSVRLNRGPYNRRPIGAAPRATGRRAEHVRAPARCRPPSPSWSRTNLGYDEAAALQPALGLVAPGSGS